MNQTQYTTLFEALTVIPDPRKARGQRYAWALVLTLLAAGLASGQQNIRAIAQWANLHAATLRRRTQPSRPCSVDPVAHRAPD
jgi:hypothetical protein